MSDEDDDESHPTEETPQMQQQPPLTNNSTSGNKQGKCIHLFCVFSLCVSFTILVSFSRGNALFALKAKINVFLFFSNGAAPEGASRVRKHLKKH